MQPLHDLLFVSSNDFKYQEVKKILSRFNINTNFFKTNLVEIQSDSLNDIATNKAKDAFSKCNQPILVEDDGLFIESLDGFPGQYSSFVFKTIGNQGILNLLNNIDNRHAKFTSIICYCDGNILQAFDANLDGIISNSLTSNGWGFDPIFIPKNTNLTFAEMNNTKNQISHRYKALEMFSKWYQLQLSNDL